GEHRLGHARRGALRTQAPCQPAHGDPQSRGQSGIGPGPRGCHHRLPSSASLASCAKIRVIQEPAEVAARAHNAPEAWTKYITVAGRVVAWRGLPGEEGLTG